MSDSLRPLDCSMPGLPVSMRIALRNLILGKSQGRKRQCEVLVPSKHRHLCSSIYLNEFVRHHCATINRITNFYPVICIVHLLGFSSAWNALLPYILASFTDFHNLRLRNYTGTSPSTSASVSSIPLLYFFAL